MSAKRRICLVGAGFIANVHAEVLRSLDGLEITAVVDPNESAARAFAKRWRIPKVFGDVQQAAAAQVSDCAHILTPPVTHPSAATPFIEAGQHVLIEKPLAATAADCAELVRLAAERGVTAGVNQNFVYHPAYTELREVIEQGRLGRLVHVTVQFNMPLRQLAARQFGHWMFQSPQNILLEQAVHPLSQILHLAGEPEEFAVTTSRPEDLVPGMRFIRTWQISARCERANAQILFSVGQEYPLATMTAICDDGTVVADLGRNLVTVQQRTRWPGFADDLLGTRRAARVLRRQGRRNAIGEVLSILRLRSRSDAFSQSMRRSISAFHSALDRNERPVADLEFGRRLVSLCECVAHAAGATPPPQPAVPATAPAGEYEVAVLGGTGFIGTHVVQALVDRGIGVGVMARNVRNLPPVFSDSRVALIRGDVTRPDDVERAIGNAKTVVNLAYGGSGTSWEEIERAMVGSAVSVAECCRRKQVKKLVHVSSIAALYLGDRRAVIRGETPPDENATRRGEYARAKALSETRLLEMHREHGLPVCILRPGVVIGRGGAPLHSGLGSYNNPQHCLGWNAGTNPLPFVLVEDVAEAVVLAALHENGVGRCYNIVGDARLTAREYVDELGRALKRPLQFHPQSVEVLFASEIGKWLIKRAVGRRVPFPSLRDLKSRGMVAQFDCEDTKRDLGWTPTADRAQLIDRGIRIHANGH